MAGHLRLDTGSSPLTQPTEFDHSLARLDAWLETLRGPQEPGPTSPGLAGYGGPVTHWWRQSLLYTGPGFDWRYEGILLGYIALWQRTAEPRWLAGARRAGDDLLRAQLPDGHYPCSAFEVNPASAGTPHEAAADLGLLRLAGVLRLAGDPTWQAYRRAAEANLRQVYLARLWDPQTRSFRDHPRLASFVPNKAATASQTFFAWSELDADDRWASQYALPNLERVLAHQVTASGPLYGAIAQNSFGQKIIPKYMPYYIARCVPALLQGYTWTGQEHFLHAARIALDFVLRQRDPAGGLLPALYPARQVNRWPRWRAGLGDVLLAADALRLYCPIPDLGDLQAFLLAGQDQSGGFQAAVGFNAQSGGAPAGLPDFRDLLHVAGWCDKAFHWLATRAAPAALPSAVSLEFQLDCTFAGQRLSFYEDSQRLQATSAGKTVYLWIKGERWAREAAPAFWLH